MVNVVDIWAAPFRVPARTTGVFVDEVARGISNVTGGGGGGAPPQRPGGGPLGQVTGGLNRVTALLTVLVVLAGLGLFAIAFGQLLTFRFDVG